jgi:hypothetical protein
MFFANALYFREGLEALVIDADIAVQGLLLDAEAISSMDTTTAEMLDGPLSELAKRRAVDAFRKNLD